MIMNHNLHKSLMILTKCEASRLVWLLCCGLSLCECTRECTRLVALSHFIASAIGVNARRATNLSAPINRDKSELFLPGVACTRDRRQRQSQTIHRCRQRSATVVFQTVVVEIKKTNTFQVHLVCTSFDRIGNSQRYPRARHTRRVNTITEPCWHVKWLRCEREQWQESKTRWWKAVMQLYEAQTAGITAESKPCVILLSNDQQWAASEHYSKSQWEIQPLRHIHQFGIKVNHSSVILITFLSLLKASNLVVSFGCRAQHVFKLIGMLDHQKSKLLIFRLGGRRDLVWTCRWLSSGHSEAHCLHLNPCNR